MLKYDSGCKTDIMIDVTTQINKLIINIFVTIIVCKLTFAISVCFFCVIFIC